MEKQNVNESIVYLAEARLVATALKSHRNKGASDLREDNAPAARAVQRSSNFRGSCPIVVHKERNNSASFRPLWPACSASTAFYFVKKRLLGEKISHS